jgi:hypothetical protein
MSLNTVIQIGKAFRNSEHSLKYFKYVGVCPKDKEGNWPVCIAIPVDPDFNFLWKEATEVTSEYEKKKLYYLRFKSSDSDTSAPKYLFGDIYYYRNVDVEKSGIVRAVKDGGNFTLERGNAFANASKEYKDIIKKNKEGGDTIRFLTRFHDSFEKQADLFKNILQYAPAFKSVLSEKKDILDTCFSDTGLYEEKRKEFYAALEDEYFRVMSDEKPEIVKKLSKKGTTPESNKEKIIQCANFRVFIHFDFVFSSSSHWYQVGNVFALLKEGLKANIVRETEQGLVPNAYIYRTLCSGSDKNDVQFPSFDKEKAYKSFVFQNEELENFLYAGRILDKSYHFRRLHETKIDMFVLPVVTQGDAITAEEYYSFFFGNGENEGDKNEDSFSGDEDPVLNIRGRFNRFDFILSDASGNTKNDLIEITGVESSHLKVIQSRISEISHRLLEEADAAIPNSKGSGWKLFHIENSLLWIMGSYLNKSFSPSSNARYTSHLLKILPLVYTKSYYEDKLLLPSLIENVEVVVRNAETSCFFQYHQMRYCLKFLLSIQNNQTNKSMEIITKSRSYQLGYDLGKMAKSLRGEIGTFEKNYVGNLSRRLVNLSDFVKLKNDIDQKLIIHEKAKITALLSHGLAIKLKEFEGSYDRDVCVFGFMEAYFKPILPKESEEGSSKVNN